MNKMRIFKRLFLVLFFFVVASTSVVTGLIGLFFQLASNSADRSSPIPSIDRPVAASDASPEREIESLVSSSLNPSAPPQENQNPIRVPITTNQLAERVSEIVSSAAVPENDNSSFLSGRDLSFSKSVLSNPSALPQESPDPALAATSTTNQPAQESDSEFFSLVAARKERLIEEIQQLPQEPEGPTPPDPEQTNPYPNRGPSVGGPYRPENRAENHADSTEMSLGELFQRKPGYNTEFFNNATHSFQIVSTARLEGECLEWTWRWFRWRCVRNAPDTNITKRKVKTHKMPVVFKGAPESADYAVFIEEDQRERLHLRLRSNFIAWRDWANSNWFGRNEPNRPIIDQITFGRNQNLESEMVEWIESRLDQSFEIPEWTIHSLKSRLFYILRGLLNGNFFVQTESLGGNNVGWKIRASKSEGDIEFSIFIDNTGKLIVEKNNERLLAIPIGNLYLDEVIDHLNELILFHTGDFRTLADHLNTHEMRVEGFRVHGMAENWITIVRFDSNQRILILRERSSGDILVNVQIANLPATDSTPAIRFNDLNFRIPKGTIFRSENPEALLKIYTNTFKKILSVKAFLSESGGEESDWISLFELLRAFFGEDVLTEVAPGDDPDPRYIGSYFQIVNTEEGSDKRMEFLMNFLRVMKLESASETTKKLLFFLRSLLEDPDRIERILDLETGSWNPSQRYQKLIEVVNDLLLERIEGSGFSLESTKEIENCNLGWNVHCYSFVFELLDNFRINDFLIFYTRVIKIFFHEIRENGPSNLSDINPQTTLLDFDTASKIFAPENDVRNITTLRSIFKEVMNGIEIVNSNGQNVNLLSLIWSTISGFWANAFGGRSFFNGRWKASVDELIDRKRDEIIDFFRKIPLSFQILDDLRTTFAPSADNEFRRENLARMIEEQTSGAISGRLADLAALSFLLATRSESDLPENTDPIPEGTESDSELLADLEAILNSEGDRFFSSLNSGNYDEFVWSDVGPGRGIRLREYLKNRTAEIRNIFVFNWVNSAGKSFTTAVRNAAAGPEVIFHFEGASPRTIDRLNSLISSQIPVPPIS